MYYGKTSRMPAFCALMALGVASLLMASSAKAGPDLSTPKKAAVSFAKAIEAGDMDAVKATSVGTDEDYATLKIVSDMLGSMKKFQQAAVAKYGDPAKALPDMSTVMSSQIEGAEEKIDGDSATLINKNKPDDKYPPTLKKTGDDWKMDLKSMNADPGFAKMKDAAPKAIAAIDDITKGIDSGKYPTFQDAIQAFGQAMSKLAPTP